MSLRDYFAGQALAGMMARKYSDMNLRTLQVVRLLLLCRHYAEAVFSATTLTGKAATTAAPNNFPHA
jgi:hypothetical protein